MTTYISSLIEPVFRHARRFSRPAQDSDQPSEFIQQATRSNVINSHENAVKRSEAKQDRAVEGDTYSSIGTIDTCEQEPTDLNSMLPPTSSNTEMRPSEQERMPDARDGASVDVDDGAAQVEDIIGNAHSREGPDHLPTQPIQVQRVVNRRHISWQSESTGSGERPPSERYAVSMSQASDLQFFDDPINSRSIPISASNMISQSSAMSLETVLPGSLGTRPAGLALPEDDGMRVTRDRIKAVQAMDADPEEKSRLMYAIMSERWATKQALTTGSHARPHSPASASLTSQDAPTTPRSSSSILDGASAPIGNQTATPSISLVTETIEDQLSVTPEDLKPTYWNPPDRPQISGAQDKSGEPQFDYGDEDLLEDQDEWQRSLGCEHYKRNVKLQCVDCNRWHTCRFCHDAVETHTLVRHRTRNMLCMVCGTPQPAAKTCMQCYETTASYFCSVCKLWDDDTTKKIYHCSACGICRIGEGLGKDFFHCPRCDVCVSIGIRDTHRCIERSVDCDCPICGEYMFSSPTTVVLMRCGHGIHQTCYNRHKERSYKCPICSKSIINMEHSFRSLDRAIEEQPMPEEFRETKAIIQCNDCRCKTSVPYHWLGLKCDECESYNTVQVQIVGPNGTENTTTHPNQNEISDAAEDARHVLANESRDWHALDNPLSEAASSRRPTSTGGMQDVRAPAGNPDILPPASSGSRSVSAAGTGRTRPTWEAEVGSNDLQLPSRRGTLSAGDESDEELDFWGGDMSPRLRALISTSNVLDAEDETDGEEEEEEDSDSSDDEADGNAHDDGDDEDEDEENDPHDIHLLGHR